MKLRIAVPATLAALTALSAAPLAHAQQRKAARKDDPGYVYRFKDDPLDAPGAAATGWVLKVHPVAAHSLLIRPRASFVTEMFKSVEKL